MSPLRHTRTKGDNRSISGSKGGITIPLLVAIRLFALSASMLVPAVVVALDSDTTIDADIPNQNGGLRIIGRAAPGALVTFLREGVIVGTQIATSTSDFDETLTNQDLGTYTYSIYYTDSSNRNSAAINFDVTILPNTTVTESGFLLPPTFVVQKIPIKRPQLQNTLGQTLQNATVTTFYHGDKYSDNIAVSSGSDNAGNWSTALTQYLHLGNYTAKGVVQDGGGNLSPATQTISFQVLLSADLNNDNRVNLTDFSILMFYYNTNTTRPADINDDGRVNLTDFSILLFYFTG